MDHCFYTDKQVMNCGSSHKKNNFKQHLVQVTSCEDTFTRFHYIQYSISDIGSYNPFLVQFDLWPHTWLCAAHKHWHLLTINKNKFSTACGFCSITIFSHANITTVGGNKVILQDSVMTEQEHLTELSHSAMLIVTLKCCNCCISSSFNHIRVKSFLIYIQCF